MNGCEVSVMIPLNLVEPWMETVISTELNDTAAMPIALLPIRNQGDPF
jgi:hypothetical protein